MIGDFFQMPTAIRTFVGAWLDLPLPYRWRLGKDDGVGRLGTSTTLGAHAWTRQHKFRVEIGPLERGQLQRLLPGGASLGKLADLVRNYVGDEQRWDLRLFLKEQVDEPWRFAFASGMDSGGQGWQAVEDNSKLIWIRSGVHVSSSRRSNSGDGANTVRNSRWHCSENSTALPTGHRGATVFASYGNPTWTSFTVPSDLRSGFGPAPHRSRISDRPARGARHDEAPTASPWCTSISDPSAPVERRRTRMGIRQLDGLRQEFRTGICGRDAEDPLAKRARLCRVIRPRSRSITLLDKFDAIVRGSRTSLSSAKDGHRCRAGRASGAMPPAEMASEGLRRFS